MDRNSRFDDQRPSGPPGQFGGNFGGGGDGYADATFAVPTDKCGLVIGKGRWL